MHTLQELQSWFMLQAFNRGMDHDTFLDLCREQATQVLNKGDLEITLEEIKALLESGQIIVNPR